MNRATLFCLAAGWAVVLLAGCSESKKDTWYQYSTDVKQREKAHTEALIQQGLSPEAAAKDWALEYSVWQTQTQGKDREVKKSQEEIQRMMQNR